MLGSKLVECAQSLFKLLVTQSVPVLAIERKCQQHINKVLHAVLTSHGSTGLYAVVCDSPLQQFGSRCLHMQCSKLCYNGLVVKGMKVLAATEIMNACGSMGSQWMWQIGSVAFVQYMKRP